METPPRPVPPTTSRPGGLPQPGSFQFQQQQQRPSLSYFIFLSILFFIISNNGGEVGVSERNSVDQLAAALARREMRRDGLAVWLGINTTYSASNGTNASEIIEFEPTSSLNPVLLPLVRQLVRQGEPLEHVFFPQNLTGIVKGRWAPGHWTYEQLGLEETFNVTSLVERANEAVPTVGEGSAPLNMTVESESVKGNETTLPQRRDRVGEGIAEKDVVANNDTVPSRVMVNQTTTFNRTELQAYFDFHLGGRVTFNNLREEQSSVIGPVVLPTKGDDSGTLLKARVGELAEWERSGPAVYLKGDISLTSHDGTTDLSLEIEAVHFLSLGTIYGYATTISEPSYIFKIPSIPFSLDGNGTETRASGRAILLELDRRIDQSRNDLLASLNTPTDFFAPSLPPCNFLLIGQVSSLPTYYTQSAYAEYYSSLFHPTGSSLRPPPPPKIAYVLYSDECGLVLQGEGESLPSPRLWERATNLGVALAVTQAVLVWLLVQQMETGSSAASSAKVAYSTVGMQAAMDCYFFIITFTIGVVTNNRASLPILVPSFLALISSLLFGMRYATSIRTATPPPLQAPRPPAPPVPPTREERAAQAADTRASGGGSADVVTPPPAPSPAGEPGDLAFSLIGVALGITIVTILVFWGWISLIVLILYSYWVPQIALNVQRGAARLALRKEYVFGTTIARLVLPGYLWGCPDNVLSVATSPWVFVLIVYSCLQGIILLLQDSRLGARFFLSASALAHLGIKDEETWEYHPVLPYSDIEGKGAGLEDCPICMEPIDRGDKEDRELGMQSKARWGYMVTPCHHVCHTECLEAWMQIKNVCPVCRGRLPSL